MTSTQRTPSRSLLSPEYRAYLDAFKAAAAEIMSSSSVVSRLKCLSNFLLHLQKSGIASPEDTDEKTVLSFFFDDAGNELRASSYRSQVKKALNVLEKTNKCFSRLSSLIPKVRSPRKLRNFFNRDEIASIRDFLLNQGSKIAKRDRAIGCLFLYTGMRASDIANLRLDNIDLSKNIITYKQPKTGVVNRIHLPAVVGNAIIDYVVNERADGGRCEYLFLSFRSLIPRAIIARTVAVVARDIIKGAGVRTEKGQDTGSHLFRHNFIKTAIEEDVPLPVISNLVGHSSPLSINPYLHSDLKHIRKCALSLKALGIMREGLFDEC